MGRPGTRSSSRLKTQALMFEVLDNPLLRDKILKHVIYEDDRVDRRAACTLRLVQKSWNESVIKILRKGHTLLYRLLPGRTDGKLESAIKTFGSSCAVDRLTPPLGLHNFADIGLPGNAELFSTFAERCGTGLVHIGVRITENGHPFNGGQLPGSWPLPRLYKLGVQLVVNFGIIMLSRGQAGGANQDRQISSKWMKSVLSGTEILDEFELTTFSGPPAAIEPPTTYSIFNSIVLPSTLVKIKMKGHRMNADFMGMLARSHLPLLTSLTFSVGDDAFVEGLLFRVLNQFRTTLKYLVICQSFKYHPPRNVSLIRFPVMDNLEEMSITSINVELERKQHYLQTRFPKLHTLQLTNHTDGMVEKWTQSSNFVGVTSLKLILADQDASEVWDIFFVSVSMATMRGVNKAFTNLHKLEIAVSQQDTGGLTYLFQEMRQLTELKLRVFGDTAREVEGAWDSILTGVPKEMIVGAREDPSFWEKNELNEKCAASLKDLSELTSLSLRDLRSFHLDPILFVGTDITANPVQFISDFTFTFALLRMPKLSELHVEGPFEVSDVMIGKWEDNHRALTYFHVHPQV